MQRNIRRGGQFGFGDARDEVGDVPGRFVPRGSLPNLRLEIGAASISAVYGERMPDPDTPRGGVHVNELERSIADLPLIAEDLLLQARALADSGAPTAAVEQVLLYVAALREGRS